MARTTLPISFSADGAPVSGETLASEACASVLVFKRTESVLVAESGVLGGEQAQMGSRLLAVGEGVLTSERRRLLYDHLGALQDLADQAGHTLGFDGLDAASGDLDPHLRTGS